MWFIVLFMLILFRVTLKWTFKKCTSKVCLYGKTAIVTGGNKGIGYETCLDLASRGCKIIIACRSNAQQEIHRIISLTHNTQVRWKHLDLASLDSVRSFCHDIYKEETKIDILINNAGIGSASEKVTQDGLEPVMQTNLFGPFLLTHLLIDLLKKPGNARIIFVSSILAFIHRISLDDLNYRRNEPANFLVMLTPYANSKLGQIVVSNEFADRLKPFGITSNALHPGIIQTAIYKNFFDEAGVTETLSKMFYRFCLGYFGRNPEEGAQRIIEMAVSDQYKSISGTYWYSSTWMPNPRITSNKQFQKSLWSAIEDFVHLEQHEKI